MICNKPYDSDDFIFSIAKCSFFVSIEFLVYSNWPSSLTTVWPCLSTESTFDGPQLVLQFPLFMVAVNITSWQIATKQQGYTFYFQSQALFFSFDLFLYVLQFVHPFSNSKNVSRTIFSLFLSFTSNFCCSATAKVFPCQKADAQKESY